MTIHHHPSEALLIDYASGAMDPARALVIASHVHACQHCREQVALAEAAGGALIETLAPADLSETALDRAMAALDAPSPARADPPPTVAAPDDWIDTPPEVAAALRRKRWVAPGVWVAPVMDRTEGAPLSYLLRVGAGMRMPDHTHRGSELTLILKGAFMDGDIRYGPGDLAEVDETVEHSPHITADGECVCLVACDNPLVVGGVIARLVQAYARI